jgi:hypothetical protein
VVDPDDLAGAQGQFALFIASLLQRAGVATMAEFGQLLAVYAAAVAETSPGQAAILASWASNVSSSTGH